MGFSPNQAKYISAFAKTSGLNSGVVAAWVAAEEPVGAHETVGYHLQDWLNIGITDSGPRGAGNPAWKDPVQAGILGAKWMLGQVSLPGFGHAAPGIVAIGHTVGQSPGAQLRAIQNSGWASGGYPQLGSLYATYGKMAPVAGIPGMAAQSGPVNPHVKQSRPPQMKLSAPQTTTSGGGIDYQAVGQAVLAREASRPISSKPFQGNPLADYAGLAASGQYTTPVTTTKTATPAPTPQAPAQAQHGHLRGGTLGSAIGMGDVNPLGAGWSLGRTDMGVDANAAAGTAIRAINDSRVTGIDPNWYHGQPLVSMVILSGPNKGKHWYVAEQINGIPHVGQVIRRGATVARYAPSGTGIEIGWAQPSGAQALAASHYSEGQVTGEGSDFRHKILRA